MTRELRRALDRAKKTQLDVGWSDREASAAAAQAVYSAERSLAAARGEQYATTFDLGVRWDTGAPLPHVVSNGSTTTLLFRVGTREPDWDGTSSRVVSPDDSNEEEIGLVQLVGCASIRFGAPNDEAAAGHPLFGRGLEFYRAHEVPNSSWLDENIRINSVHPHHSEERWRSLHHCLLAFHDDMFEALARDIDGRSLVGTMPGLLAEAAAQLTSTSN